MEFNKRNDSLTFLFYLFLIIYTILFVLIMSAVIGKGYCWWEGGPGIIVLPLYVFAIFGIPALGWIIPLEIYRSGFKRVGIFLGLILFISYLFILSVSFSLKFLKLIIPFP